ncbi:hypothetical protein BJX70DRAFT_113864 [Aspergillus crustosus]
MLNILLWLLLAISAVSATGIVPTVPTIESSIVNRLLQLDLGLRATALLLDSLDEEGANITVADVITSYGKTTAPGPNTIQQLFSSPCDETTQFVLCHVYHTFALTSISLYTDLAEGSSDFTRDHRNGLQEGFARFYMENAFFVDTVAPTGVPLCRESIQYDDWALHKAFMIAFNALTPMTVK